MPSGKQVFDRTIYGGSGNTGNSGSVFGGGAAPVMGGAADVAKRLNLRPQRNNGRARGRPVKRGGRGSRR